MSKINMQGEIPVFRRCCCCLPLRYGLLAWGYFKMIADALLLIMMSFSLRDTIKLIQLLGDNHHGRFYSDLAIILSLIILFFADFIVTILFIVGAHKKNVKLIRVFYILSIVLWVLTLVQSVLASVRTLIDLIQNQKYYWGLFMMESCFYFVVLAVQSYFILLLRSEIIKLRNTGEFRFVNHAAEAECTDASTSSYHNLSDFFNRTSTLSQR